MTDNKLILSRAKSAVMSRDFALAIRLYTELLRKKPDDMELLMQLGALFIKAGQDQKALPIYKQISMLEPTNFNALLSLGGIYRRLKRYQDSITVLEKALETGRNDTQANYSLGFTYKFMGKYDDAIDCFESVVAENPSDALAYNHLGVIYALRKEYDKAVNAYNHGLKADPNHPILHLNLAHTYEELHNYSKAAVSYATALRVRPGWMEAIGDFSNLLLKLRKAKEAEGLVGQALRLDPRNNGMHALLGKIYVQESDYENAREEFSEVLGSDPKNRSALSGLALSYERLNQIQKALEIMKVYEDVDSQNPDMLKQFSDVLLSAGKPEAAADKIKTVLSENPRDLAALDLAAQYYAMKKNQKSVLACKKKIETIDPSFYDFYKDIGMRFNQIGNLREARHHLDIYLGLRPNDVSGIMALAAVDEAEGKNDSALALYKKILEKDQYNKAAVLAFQRLEKQLKAEDRSVSGSVGSSSASAENSLPSAEDDFVVPNGVEINLASDDSQFEFAEGGTDNKIVNSETEDPLSFDYEARNQTSDEESDDGTVFLNDDDNFDYSDATDIKTLDGLVQTDEPIDTDESESETEIDDTLPDTVVIPSDESESIPKESYPEYNSVRKPDETSVVKEDAVKVGDAPPISPYTGEKLDEAVKAAHETAQVAKDIRKEVEDHTKAAEEAALRNADETVQRVSEAAGEAVRSALEGIRKQDEESSQDREEEEESLFDSAARMLPSIANILIDRKMAERYVPALDLFKKLRSLSEYLPPEKKAEFLSSKTRLLLDYLIERLSGRPGLLATAQALRDSGVLPNMIAEESVVDDSTEFELTGKVLDSMKGMTQQLPDINLAEILTETANEIIERMKYMK